MHIGCSIGTSSNNMLKSSFLLVSALFFTPCKNYALLFHSSTGQGSIPSTTKYIGSLVHLNAANVSWAHKAVQM